jgi:hypothetical protein
MSSRIVEQSLSTITLFEGVVIADFDGFPLPLPVGCRECGKRKWEVAACGCRGALGDAVMSRTVLASRAAGL